MAAKKRATPRKNLQPNTNRPIDRLTPEARHAVQANVQRFLAHIQRRRLQAELRTLGQEATINNIDDDELEFDLTAPLIKGHHKSVSS